VLLQGGMQSTASRLANVAISRAQGKFVGLFNDTYVRQQLDSFNVFRNFSERLRSSSQVLPLIFTDAANFTVWQFTLPGITVYPNPSAARQAIEADLTIAQHAVAIDWSTQLNSAQHFSLASLRPGTNIVARGSDIASSITSLPNTRIWRSDSFSNTAVFTATEYSLIWRMLDLLGFPGLALYLILGQLLPADSGASVAQRLLSNQAPFGSCELCTQPLWPQPAQNEYSRPRISCVTHLQQGRNMNLQDATQYAQFMGCTCEACGAALQGLQNGATGQIFLACSRSSCNWRTSLNQII